MALGTAIRLEASGDPGEQIGPNVRQSTSFQRFHLVECFLISKFGLVKLRDEEVVQRLEVPSLHEGPENPPKNAHEATKGGKEVEHRVAGAAVLDPIQVHLECHVDPAQVFLFQREQRHLGQREEVLLLYHRPLVQVDRVVVLQDQMRLLQLVGDGLPDLTADRDVVNARLGNFRLLKEVLSVESDLIVEYNYVFAC